MIPLPTEGGHANSADRKSFGLNLVHLQHSSLVLIAVGGFVLGLLGEMTAEKRNFLVSWLPCVLKPRLVPIRLRWLQVVDQEELKLHDWVPWRSSFSRLRPAVP